MVVKLGTEGAMALCNNEIIKVAAVSVEAVDPVGAGDSFDAGFLYAYLQGRSLKDCMAAGQCRRGSMCHAGWGHRSVSRPRTPGEVFFASMRHSFNLRCAEETESALCYRIEDAT